jgi:hypothetical protein
MQAKFNTKYAVFSVIAIMTVYVLFHNERFLVEPENPVWQRYEPFKWWLLPHGIAGALVLLIAPLQLPNFIAAVVQRNACAGQGHSSLLQVLKGQG